MYYSSITLRLWSPLCRLLVYNFWSHDTRLSTSTSRRLLNILEQTYSSATENEFLGHATYLLLELTSRSPDYKRPVFDTPLQECRFEVSAIVALALIVSPYMMSLQDLRVATSWKRRYATLQMPGFAESILGSQANLSPVKASQHGVRATVAGTPQFSQTIAPTAAGGGNDVVYA